MLLSFFKFIKCGTLVLCACLYPLTLPYAAGDFSPQLNTSRFHLAPKASHKSNVLKGGVYWAKSEMNYLRSKIPASIRDIPLPYLIGLEHDTAPDSILVAHIIHSLKAARTKVVGVEFIMDDHLSGSMGSLLQSLIDEGFEVRTVESIPHFLVQNAYSELMEFLNYLLNGIYLSLSEASHEGKKLLITKIVQSRHAMMSMIHEESERILNSASRNPILKEEHLKIFKHLCENFRETVITILSRIDNYDGATIVSVNQSILELMVEQLNLLSLERTLKMLEQGRNTQALILGPLHVLQLAGAFSESGQPVFGELISKIQMIDLIRENLKMLMPRLDFEAFA